MPRGVAVIPGDSSLMACRWNEPRLSSARISILAHSRGMSFRRTRRIADERRREALVPVA